MWRLTRWALPPGRFSYGDATRWSPTDRRSSQLQGYSIAFLTVLLALLLTLLLWRLHRLNSIYPMFLAAVMVSSWYGGFNPGLLATFLSAIWRFQPRIVSNFFVCYSLRLLPFAPFLFSGCCWVQCNRVGSVCGSSSVDQHT